VTLVATEQRHWYVMLDCRFREPVETTVATAKATPFWARILPNQKMRGYYRCFGLTAESEQAARKLAFDDTIHNPYFHLNVSEIEIVELEEVSRNDAMFQRLVAKSNGHTNGKHNGASNGHAHDPIWFRDGGGYYW
jgi:hypothetical protein